MSTLSNRQMKSVRKVHVCEQCNRKIDVGMPAQYHFGIWDGEPVGTYTHLECHEAAHHYATLNDLWFEEYPFFQFMEDSEYEHHGWLLENHPVVADRLNIRRAA